MLDKVSCITSTICCSMSIGFVSRVVDKISSVVKPRSTSPKTILSSADMDFVLFDSSFDNRREVADIFGKTGRLDFERNPNFFFFPLISLLLSNSSPFVSIVTLFTSASISFLSKSIIFSSKSSIFLSILICSVTSGRLSACVSIFSPEFGCSVRTGSVNNGSVKTERSSADVFSSCADMLFSGVVSSM